MVHGNPNLLLKRKCGFVNSWFERTQPAPFYSEGKFVPVGFFFPSKIRKCVYVGMKEGEKPGMVNCLEHCNPCKTRKIVNFWVVVPLVSDL